MGSKDGGNKLAEDAWMMLSVFVGGSPGLGRLEEGWMALGVTGSWRMEKDWVGRGEGKQTDHQMLAS